MIHASLQHRIVQKKLAIGQPNDRYEREADAVADQVMSMHNNDQPIQRKCEACEEEELQMKPLAESITPVIQKQPIEEEEEAIQAKMKNDPPAETESISSQLQTARSEGSKLPDNSNQRMSKAFGRDFSDVRIHHNESAVNMNRSLNSKAFTSGNDIYFNDGEYQPGTSNGDKLLAHELTHVVQQNRSHSTSSLIQPKLTVEGGYHQYLKDRVPGGRSKRDPASKLSKAEKISQVKPMIEELSPSFTVKSDGEVKPKDSIKSPSSDLFAKGKNPVASCCLHILSRPACTTDWKILLSDVVGPQTHPHDFVIVIPTKDAPIDYGAWTADPGSKRSFYKPKIILGHEMCGHASLMELKAHPPSESRVKSDVHDPTVRIENVISEEQGIPESERRGLAESGRHRGESFARIVIRKYPINKVSVYSIPDKKEQAKLGLAKNLIKVNDFFVEIRGHTDPSGTDEINDRKSLQRAEAVKGHIAGSVRNSRPIDKTDPKSKRVSRFRLVEGVRDTQPPKEGAEDPNNWRRVEIFMASYPAGTENPPAGTPTEVDKIKTPEKAKELAKSGDACEQKLVKQAYPDLKKPKEPGSAPAPVHPESIPEVMVPGGLHTIYHFMRMDPELMMRKPEIE